MISQKKKVVCVLGMHRSGTSALTRAVNLLGAHIGSQEKLLQPNEYNPQGYWENKVIVDFHDRLLKSFFLSWDSLLPMPEEWWKQPEVKPYRQELIDIIGEEVSEQKLWVWKDPRTSILLPLWIEVLEELNIEPVFLISLRNPLDVAVSLKRRDNFEKNKSLALWQMYSLSSFYWTKNFKRLVIHYNKLINDWKNSVEAIADVLGLSVDYKQLRESMAAFIKPGLSHSHFSMEDLDKDRDVSEPVKSTYYLLNDAEKSVGFLNSKRFSDEISKLFCDYKNYFRMVERSIEEIHHKNQIVQVFWKTGEHFSEQDSKCTQVIVDGNFHSYEFSLPPKISSPLRLDPVNFLAHIDIKSIEFFDDDLDLLDQKPFSIRSANNGFAGVTSISGILSLDNQDSLSLISTNIDPIIYIEDFFEDSNDNPIKIRINMKIEKYINQGIVVALESQNNNIMQKNEQLSNMRIELEDKDRQLSRQAEQIAKMQTELEDKDGQLSQQAEQIAKMQTELEDKDGQLSRQAEQIKKMQAELEDNCGQLSWQNKQIAKMQEDLQDNRERLNQLTDQIIDKQLELAAVKEHIKQMVNSSSWRVTAPLRWFGSYFRKKNKN